MAFSASSSFLHSIHKTHFITERQFNLSQQDIESRTLYPRRTKKVVVWEPPWARASRNSIEHQTFGVFNLICFQSLLLWIRELKGRYLPKTVRGRLGTKHQAPDFQSNTLTLVHFSQIIPVFLHPIIESLLPSRCCGGRSVEGSGDMKTTQSLPSRSYFP